MIKVTKRQKELLKIIYGYVKSNGYPPTIEEMREGLKVVSNQSVLDLLRHLEAKKCIQRHEGVARSIAILPDGYEVLGRPALVGFLGISSAGVPIDMIEINDEWESISDEVAKLNSDVFMLKISGDSMINAGIEDGDVVLVKDQKEFASGDIVLAQVSDQSTIKRFISDDKPPFIYLKPENSKYKNIPFTAKGQVFFTFL